MTIQGEYIFFIRANNDLDHIAPVIYKIGALAPEARIYVYIATYLTDFAGDFRLTFLEDRGVVVRHAIDALEWPAPVRWLYFAAVKSGIKPLRFAARAFISLFKKRLFGQEWFIKRFFAAHPAPLCIMHDHNSDHYRKLTACARQKKITTLALPHSTDNLDNFLIDNREVNPYAICPKDREPYAVDRVIVSSHHMRDHLVEKGAASAENTAILGSARFCEEWIDVLRRITPWANLPANDDFKIVFMLPKDDKNTFEEECLRIIKTMGKIKNVRVAVKIHTRSGRFARISAPNVNFYAGEMPSNALIDWADLTVFAGTSIIIDNMMRDKPVLHLRRVSSNKSMFDRYVDSWHIDCRDDLCHAIFRLQSGAQKRTYTEAERENLLKTLVEPKGKDVLGLYTAEIFAAIEKAKAA